MENITVNTNTFTISTLMSSAYEMAGMTNLYTKYIERKTRKKHLSNTIMKGFNNCILAIQSLDMIENYLKDDMLFCFGAKIPQKLYRSSLEISSLENKKTYLLSSHFTSIKIIQKRYQSLRKILGETVVQNLKKVHHKEIIKKTIRYQISCLKNDLIILAETNLQLMKTVQSEYLSTEIREMHQSLKEIYTNQNLLSLK